MCQDPGNVKNLVAARLFLVDLGIGFRHLSTVHEMYSILTLPGSSDSNNEPQSL